MINGVIRFRISKYTFGENIYYNDKSFSYQCSSSSICFSENLINNLNG